MKYYNNKKNLSWFEFPILQKYHDMIYHASYTRLFGKSIAPYDGLNVSKWVGDDTNAVLKNIQTIQNHFEKHRGTSCHYVDMHQLHGKEVELIHSFEEALSLNSPNCDAIATQTPGIILAIQHADCLPILLFDPQKKVIAAIHAGWKGMCAQIISHTIEKICTTWNVNPRNLIAAIGPSIGPDELEFQGWEKQLPSFLFPYIEKETMKLDLWKAAIDELVACRVLPSHISCTDHTTYGNEKLFFSFRRKKVTGRNATAIYLANSLL